MSTWGNNRANFAHTWNGVRGPRFVIEEGSGTDDVRVTPRGARGLADDETYRGTLDTTEGEVRLVFELRADGLTSGGKKKLLFDSAVDSSSLVLATTTTGGSEAWGADPADFEGVWDLVGGGKIEIRDHGPFQVPGPNQTSGLIQPTGVEGLANLVYLGVCHHAEKKITLTFELANNGYRDGNPQLPREILYLFPEVLLASSIPTEGERFEEVGAV